MRGCKASSSPYIISTPGDLDLIAGEIHGRLYYWERAADGTLVAQTRTSNPFDGIDVGSSSYFAPAAVDWDGDGQPILFTLTASDTLYNPICTQIQKSTSTVLHM